MCWLQWSISDFGCGDGMAKVDVKCPFCERTDPVKKHGYGKSGYQRYRCQSCKRSFLLDYAYRACQPTWNEGPRRWPGAAIRDNAWVLHISIHAVVRNLKNSRRGM